jgi:hypothetical protein
VFDRLKVFVLNLLEGNQLHDELLLPGVQCARNLSTLGHEYVADRLRTIQLDVDFPFVFVLDHVLDDVAFTFQILHFRVFLVLFAHLQLFPQIRNYLAMGLVVKLSSDVILYQNVYLSVRVNR